MARPCLVERSHSTDLTHTSGPFSPSAPLMSHRLPFIRVTSSGILRRLPQLLSSSPNWRALPWRLLLAVSPPGLVDPGSRTRHGPFFSSSLRQDARVRQCRRSLLCLAFSGWHRNRQDHRLHECNYNHQGALFDYRVAFAMWNERYFGASARRAGRADFQAWLLAQTGRICSLVRALKGKRRRLVPRAFLPPSRLASRSSWGALLHGVWPQG